MTANTTQLSLYNAALRHLGERKLASLSDATEPRRYLDDEYPDTVLLCLRAGNWNFAIRSVQMDASGVVTPQFGYQSAFEKPADWLRTVVLSPSETFRPPLRDYQDQSGYWIANLQTLYARYVSATLGMNLALWPPDFAEYVGAALARTIALRITASDDKFEKAEQREKKYRTRAIATDAMDQAADAMPSGTWVTSRAARGTTTSASIKTW